MFLTIKVLFRPCLSCLLVDKMNKSEILIPIIGLLVFKTFFYLNKTMVLIPNKTKEKSSFQLTHLQKHCVANN